jgi:hypothetical protein
MGTMTIERLSIPLQTLYADLLDRAWGSDLAELMAGGGSAYHRTVKGRRYWYWKTGADGHGERKSRYLGVESDALLRRLGADMDLAATRKDRALTVRVLRDARLPVPDRLSGAVLEALSAAGAFRLRAVVVGSVAFQCYAPLLGVRFPAAAGRTGDLDIAQFHSVALAVDDEIDADILTVLRRVDQRFQAVQSPTDGRQPMRYALRAGSQDLFSVDVLCPLRGPMRGSLTALKALRANAQILRFLDFLLYREINAVALYGGGVPVNVPAPERYALHKLIVSQLRIETPASQAKSAKDLQQADALIRVLAADRPDELREAWEELRSRGPSWRTKADRATKRLPEDTREVLESFVEPSGIRESIRRRGA